VGPQRFDVGGGGGSNEMSTNEALSLMRKARPQGCTPLTSHILDIRGEVASNADYLRRRGERVAIVIATDGLPTDERGYGGKALQNEFVESLRMLEGLPVWVVIRLCTDEDDVVDFYNELDSVLELSVEVLDDFVGEAKEVYEHNPWLNYALPVHRMREMGYHDRLFDMLDERLLTRYELRDFCYLLFGDENLDGMPDPNIDWEDFVAFLERLLRREMPQWVSGCLEFSFCNLLHLVLVVAILLHSLTPVLFFFFVCTLTCSLLLVLFYWCTEPSCKENEALD